MSGSHRVRVDVSERITQRVGLGLWRRPKRQLRLRILRVYGLLRFQGSEVGSRTPDDVLRYTGERCDLQAVALISGPRSHCVQEHELAVVLGRIEVNVTAGWQLVGQRCQLEVMCGEQRECLCRLTHEMGRGPRERQAVEGARTTSDFVHEDQALVRCVVQNRGGLGHFDHEGRATAGEIVGCTNARENSIERPDTQFVGRYETANVREYRDQGSLSHVRRLAAHVRTCDDDQALRCIQRHVICHEWRIDDLLDDEMTSALDFDAGLVCDLRLRHAKRVGALRETQQDIEFGDSERRLLQVGKHLEQRVEEHFVQVLLASQCPFARAQHLVFEGLEFGRDVTLRRLQRLPPYIVDRGLVGLSLADFDVIAMHPVVAEFQRGDAGARLLACLQVEQELVRVFGDGAEIVEFVVVAVGDDAAVADEHRRIVNDCPSQQLLLAAMIIDLVPERSNMRRLDHGELRQQIRKPRQNFAQLPQVSRACGAQRDPGQDSFGIANAVQTGAQLLAAGARQDRIDCLVSRLEDIGTA